VKSINTVLLTGAVVKLKALSDRVIALTEKNTVITLKSETLEKIDEFEAIGADFFRYTNGFDISKDGRYLAFAVKGEPKYQIWDISAKKRVFEAAKLHTAEVYSLKFSPYAQKLASGGMDGKSFVFDFEEKKASGPYDIRSDFISAFAFNSNGRHIAIAGFDNEIRLHKISDTENHISIVGLEEPIVRLEFINEKELATFYREGQSLVFDVSTKKVTISPKKLNDGVSAFEVINGYVYISGRERNVRLVNGSDFEELSEQFIKTQSIVSSMDKIGDNGLIVGCLDGTVSSYELDSDNKEFEAMIMEGNFAGAYTMVEDNPFLKQDYNFAILEEAWHMSLQDIIHNIEDGKMDAAKKMSASYMQTAEKRLVLQTVFKQFDEFARLKYAVERSNNELMKSLIQKNSYFKMTKLYEKIKSHL
jgi:WD40 repeat protein